MGRQSLEKSLAAGRWSVVLRDALWTPRGIRSSVRLCLLDETVRHETEAGQQQVRHPDHQVDAVVVGCGFLQGVVVLRTGGACRDGVLSGRARAGRAR